jgi:hypothetical protein
VCTSLSARVLCLRTCDSIYACVLAFLHVRHVVFSNYQCPFGMLHVVSHFTIKRSLRTFSHAWQHHLFHIMLWWTLTFLSACRIVLSMFLFCMTFSLHYIIAWSSSAWSIILFKITFELDCMKHVTIESLHDLHVCMIFYHFTKMHYSLLFFPPKMCNFWHWMNAYHFLFASKHGVISLLGFIQCLSLM